MGIDHATWRARIGLNYYHMCHPLQTWWRSSGGRLYQAGVASWGVGEVMNDTPLVLKGCMTVVALTLLLQYVVHCWSKLNLRGGGGKMRCHWRGSTFQVKGTTRGTNTVKIIATPTMKINNVGCASCMKSFPLAPPPALLAAWQHKEDFTNIMPC